MLLQNNLPGSLAIQDLTDVDSKHSMHISTQPITGFTVMSAGYYDENFIQGMLQIFNTNDRKISKMAVALAANYKCSNYDTVNMTGKI